MESGAVDTVPWDFGPEKLGGGVSIHRLSRSNWDRIWGSFIHASLLSFLVFVLLVAVKNTCFVRRWSVVDSDKIEKSALFSTHRFPSTVFCKYLFRDDSFSVQNSWKGCAASVYGCAWISR